MKNPLQSKTLWGLAVALVGPWFARKCGVTLDDAAQQQIVEQIITAIGAALTIYGRFTAEVPLKNPLASDRITTLLLPITLAGLLASGVGCSALKARWDGLAPTTQTALENAAKGAAKIALSIGLSELGDRVHELKPYTQRLAPLFETTFAQATTDPQAIGNGLAAHVQAVVPPEHQATVRAALKDALADKSVGAGPVPAVQTPSQKFNAALAARL